MGIGMSACAQLPKFSDLSGSGSAVVVVEPQPKALKEQAAPAEVKPVSPFLAGLTPEEIKKIKREALRTYGRDWRVIGVRSQYVRAPLLAALDEIKAPRELQLIPVVESSYNPYAESEAGASGLWQLMPRTADDLRIKTSKYFDGRRDIAASTKGAAKFLMRQHRRFGNWPMALASYHLGPAAVQRRLDRRPWTPANGLRRMPLPPITKTYIRHILGLIALQEEGRLAFPEPFPTRTIQVQAPVDLAELHEKSNLPAHQIFRFNPKLALAQYYGDKTEKLTLRISLRRVPAIKKHLPEEPPEYTTITVQAGETMEDICSTYGTTIRTVREANPELPPVRLVAGQRLRIPSRLLNDTHAEANPLAKPAPTMVASNP